MSPSLLASLRLQTDELSMLFLALFGVVWIVAGVHAAVTVPAKERRRFFAFYLPAAAGGLLVAVSGDAVSFYVCFSLMALASWGLITHDRTAESGRAGAIYLTLTALSEAALLAALVVLASSAGSTHLSAFDAADSSSAAFAAALVLVAVALKIGTLPVIGVLPLTYHSAPAGAAAALAGASAKVGALALLRLLPFGMLTESWANGVMTAGLATAFVAAGVGLFTTSPRAILGYSSSSQMGLILVAAGAGLALPEAAPLATGAIAALALHHGLAKAALVLGADVVARTRGRSRALLRAVMAVPAAALVGVPLTSGFVGKYVLKDAVLALSGDVPQLVYALLPWTAVGTGLLMLRFFHALRRQPDAERRSWALPGMLVLLAGVASAAWLYPATWNDHAIKSALSPSALWPALWPGLLAVALGVLSVRVTHVVRAFGAVAPGDVLLNAGQLVPMLDRVLRMPKRIVGRRRLPRIASRLTALERRAVSWPIAAGVFVLLLLLAVALIGR